MPIDKFNAFCRNLTIDYTIFGTFSLYSRLNKTQKRISMPTKNVLTDFATCYILTTKALYSDPYIQFVNYYTQPFLKDDSNKEI